VHRADHVGEVAEVLRCSRGLTAGLRDRQTRVERLERGDHVRPCLDRVRDRDEPSRPLPRRHADPCAVVERSTCSSDCAVDVGGASRGERAVGLLPRRLGHLQLRAVRAVDVLTVDVVTDR
jgi:hypothetical protein